MATDAADEQISLDAAEYVLGTLDEGEVQRFEANLADRVDARSAVVYWENRLGALGLALAPVAPPALVWDKIAATLPGRAAPGRTDGAAVRKAAPRVGLWRGLALAASVAALVLAGLLYTGFGERRRPPETAPAYASLVHDKTTGTSWLITVAPGSHTASIAVLGNFNMPQGKMLRGWFKPANGPPVLIGQLPYRSGEHTLRIPNAVARKINQPAQLLVSLENKRYAGTSKPHGKVLFAVPIAHRHF